MKMENGTIVRTTEMVSRHFCVCIFRFGILAVQADVRLLGLHDDDVMPHRNWLDSLESKPKRAEEGIE
jgi:hypothetical protein